MRAKGEKHLAGEAEASAVEIGRSEGCAIYDARGKKYIDFLSGWCVGNLGWSQAEIARAIRNFKGPFYAYPEYNYAPWEELAERLTKLAPGKLTKVFRATGGSEAVDIALQAAMLHTGRGKFVSIEGAYHGNAIASRSVGDGETRQKFPNLLRNCSVLKLPLDAAALGRAETLLKRRDVAAFIMEPVICNLGVYVPETAFMSGLQKLCRRYGSLLIADEVATGFGRTGRLFACEHYDWEPDFLCLAKAITGGYAPMGAVLATAPVAKSMGEVGAYSTYGWHPLSTAAARANLIYWAKHRTRILDNVENIGSLMAARLSKMDFKGGGTTRRKGLAVGVELRNADYASGIVEKCRKHGLLVAAEDDALTLFPPLVIDRKTANDGLDILERSSS